MTEQTAPETETASETAAPQRDPNAAWLVARDRSHEITRILNSESTHALQRAVREDDNVDWREFLREAGGALKLADYLTADGQPDLDRVRETVDRVFHRDSETEYAGGMIMRRFPKNRPPRD
jgi:hypothetical protein